MITEEKKETATLPRGVRGSYGTYRATFNLNGFEVYLGQFSTAQAASEKWEQAAKVKDECVATGKPLTPALLTGRPDGSVRGRLANVPDLLNAPAAAKTGKPTPKGWSTKAGRHAPPDQALAPLDDRRAGWLKEYRQMLASRGTTAHHISTTCRHVHEILLVAGRTMTERAIVNAVGAILAKGRSLRTCNAYLRSIKSFITWCVRAKFMREDVARHVKSYKQDKDRRHRRTAFTDEELGRLLGTVEKSARLWQGITGQERAALYHAAVCTGLRAGTLRVMEAGQFHVAPTDAVAFVQVRAEQIKDAEDLIVPIEKRAAAVLRAYLAKKLPTAPAFRMPPDLVRMLRADLADANIDYCQRVTLDNGTERRLRVLDFHALRHTFGTRCARAGVPLPTLQKWMGHSDPKLTANIYNQVQLSDASAALAMLSPITPAA